MEHAEMGDFPETMQRGDQKKMLAALNRFEERFGLAVHGHGNAFRRRFMPRRPVLSAPDDAGLATGGETGDYIA